MSTNTPPTIGDVDVAKHVADYSAANYNEALSDLVQALHNLADDVARYGAQVDTPSTDGVPRFTRAAHDVASKIMWGLANVGPHRLATQAARADHYEANHQRLAQLLRIAYLAAGKGEGSGG